MMAKANEKTFFPYYFFEITVIALFTIEAVLILAVLFPPAIGREIDLSANSVPGPNGISSSSTSSQSTFRENGRSWALCCCPGSVSVFCYWLPSWKAAMNDRS